MIQCQSCGNENVQRLSIVYDGGISEINAKDSGVGVGFGSGGIGIGLGSSKIKGSNQSQLSKKAEPPTKKRIFKHMVWWALGFFIVPALLVTMLHWNSSFARFIVFLAYVAAAGTHLYSDFQFNRKIFPGRFAKWRDSFFCHRCGEIFVRKELDQTRTESSPPLAS